MREKFLPINKTDLKQRGWKELDIILITGDAYVDHPSYGASIISRVLEADGFKVGIITQPDWRNLDDVKRLGRPRLFFGITAGNTDSMIANYTANKRLRLNDEYSPGNKAGLRPNRAVIVYSNLVRQAFKDCPIVIGGIEASLRRLAHYDYWDNEVRRSILLDTRANILVYGMGERQIREISQRLNKDNRDNLKNIPGTAVVLANLEGLSDYLEIPGYKEVKQDKNKFSKAFRLTYRQMNPCTAKALVQKYDQRFVIQYPPALPLKTKELDAIYELPYVYAEHYGYDKSGGVKSFETVRFSITAHRGCCGECSFCSLFFHQGRIVQSRSVESIVNEACRIASRIDFKGTITDIGGPTANLYMAFCQRWSKNNYCTKRSCLIPEKCSQLKLGYQQALIVYRKVLAIPKVKFVFISSGLRYDLLIQNEANNYLKELCRRHISGLMKVAPEYCSDEVLRFMNKPRLSVYEKFVEIFKAAVKAAGKKIFIVNYFISAHPGSGLSQALETALYLAQRKIKPEQIQDFIPSPMTRSTVMYWTGKDPFTQDKTYVAQSFKERKMQRALIQYANPKNRSKIIAALKILGRINSLPRLIFPPAIKNNIRGVASDNNRKLSSRHKESTHFLNHKARYSRRKIAVDERDKQSR